MANFGIGMCTAIDMIRRNGSRDFVILEKGSQVGGTWNDNKYPGCCCDGSFFSNLISWILIVILYSLESSLLLLF